MANRTEHAGSPRIELAEHYAALLEEQEASGLTMAEFAEEVGVSSATLYSWRRRLGEGQRPARLVEVALDGVERRRTPMLLRIDDRYEVELDPTFEADALTRLLEVLAEC